jgi:hypothetical protein
MGHPRSVLVLNFQGRSFESASLRSRVVESTSMRRLSRTRLPLCSGMGKDIDLPWFIAGRMN